MYGSATTDTDAVAAIDVRETGRIQCIHLDIAAVLNADSAASYWEVSFGSSRQPTTNDTTAVIASAEVIQSITTSGATSHGKSVCINCDIPVQAGERLYLHHEATGTVAASRCRAALYTTGSQSRRPSVRRR
jgi:hypothetical protein